MKPRFHSILLLGGVVVGGLVCVLSGLDCYQQHREYEHNHPDIIQTKRVGETVVAALVQFRKDSGRFPDELQELVPDWLEALPSPEFGEKSWEYRVRKDGQCFTISVYQHSSGYPLMYCEGCENGCGWGYDH